MPKRKTEQRAQWRLIGLLARFSWSLRGRLGLTAVFTLARAICLGLFIHFLHRAISSLLPGDMDTAISEFLFAAAAMLAFQVVAAACQFLGDEAQRWFLEGVELETLQWALRHLILLPADYFRTHPLAKLVVQIERLQFLVRAVLTSALTFATRSAAILGTVIGVFLQSPWFVGISLGLLVTITLLIWRRSAQLRQLAKQELVHDVGFIDRVLSIFSNLRDLHNYGLQEQALRQFDDSCKFLATQSMRVAKLHARAGVVLNAAGILALSGMVVGALWWEAGVASVLTCFAALGLMLGPLGEVVRSRTAMQTRLLKVQDLFELIDRLIGDEQRSGGRPLDRPIERLAFERVRYGRERAPILQDITFEVRRGEILGIIGRSGAGKTTLANLALRLQDPASGRILINGEDAQGVELASFWRQSACMTQVPCRVGGTIAEEVALVRPEATEAEVRRALIEADIDPALGGQILDSEEVKDDEPNLAWHSRGLQQRTEWARILLRPAQLVVLDEPTSLADAAGEQRLVESLLKHRGERITLLISHRPTTLAVCDRLLVLDAGRIVAEGPRTEILSRWLPELELTRECA